MSPIYIGFLIIHCIEIATLMFLLSNQSSDSVYHGHNFIVMKATMEAHQHVGAYAEIFHMMCLFSRCT
jgi:hypothetical protein